MLAPQIEQIKIPILGIFGGKDKHAGFSDEAVSDVPHHASCFLSHVFNQMLHSTGVCWVDTVHSTVCACTVSQAALAAEKKIREAGGDIEMKIFPNAPHAFLNQLIRPEGVECVQSESCDVSVACMCVLQPVLVGVGCSQSHFWGLG